MKNRGVSELLAVVILILIALAASAVIAMNFNKQITAMGKNFDISVNYMQLIVSSSNPTGPQFLSGWNYRREVVIDNTKNNNDLNNYQVKVILNSTNFSWDKARSDGGDIRFTDSDGTTLLPYWIEKWDYINKYAIIWVKVNIPASSKKLIYLYYGNPSATNQGSIDSVFIRNSIYLISTYWPWRVDSIGAYADNHQEFDKAIASNPTLYGSGYVNKVSYDYNPYGPNDVFMLRFKFLFKATKTGTYYFGTDSDDASEIIWNDGDQDVRHYVIASWYGGHGASGYKYWLHDGSLYLKAGQAIWIEYRQQEWFGGQRAAMGIKIPGGSWTTVYTSNFPNQIYTRIYTNPEPSVSIGYEEANPSLNALILFRAEISNSGNIPVRRLTIKLGNTVIYDKSLDLEPGNSISIDLRLSGNYEAGESYTVFITFYSPSGDYKMKQYLITAEPM